MILADTSIWVDHLRFGDAQLSQLIMDDNLVCHPFIIGELALGSLRNRRDILSFLDSQSESPVASDAEVRKMIEHHELFAMGIGYIDAHLLASTLLDRRMALWTRDKKLQAAARKAGVTLYDPPASAH